MVRQITLAATGCALAFAAAASVGSAQHLPLAPDRAAGQTVTPAFEGWYRNADGTYTLSFGYYNRNTREVIEVPIGRSNFIAPGDSNQGQPTRFEPQRHWGVFTVRVPADFGQKKLVWTLTWRGETFTIPGSLKDGWQIDGEGEPAGGNLPPVVRFDSAGAQGAGPAGIVGAPMAAKVGQPLTINVWAVDPPRAGRGAAGGRGGAGGTVTLAWFKHQGTGEVTFAPQAPRPAGGKATTQVTFSEPGVYMLRVRANDASGVTGAGHAQCCWTNGFVKVTVTR